MREPSPLCKEIRSHHSRSGPNHDLKTRTFKRAAPSAADPEKKTSHSNSNFNQVNNKIPSFSTHRFQIQSKWGLFRTSRMPFWKPKRLPDDQKSTLSHPGRPRCAPGSPEGELDCIYCSGLHTSPRDPGYHLVRISPGPRPRGDYFYLLFSTSFSLPPSF